MKAFRIVEVLAPEVRRSRVTVATEVDHNRAVASTEVEVDHTEVTAGIEVLAIVRLSSSLLALGALLHFVSKDTLRLHFHHTSNCSLQAVSLPFPLFSWMKYHN